MKKQNVSNVERIRESYKGRPYLDPTYDPAFKEFFDDETTLKEFLNHLLHLALMVLKCFKKPIDSIIIYTDSMYVIGCATLGWQRKKNIFLWKLFDEELDRVSKLCSNITFQHVKGHADSKWNNYADKLAVEASQELLN